MHMSFIVLQIRLKHISTLQWMLEKYNTDVICCCQSRVHSLGNTVLDSTDSYMGLSLQRSYSSKGIIRKQSSSLFGDQLDTAIYGWG